MTLEGALTICHGTLKGFKILQWLNFYFDSSCSNSCNYYSSALTVKNTIFFPKTCLNVVFLIFTHSSQRSVQLPSYILVSSICMLPSIVSNIGSCYFMWVFFRCSWRQPWGSKFPVSTFYCHGRTYLLKWCIAEYLSAFILLEFRTCAQLSWLI